MTQNVSRSTPAERDPSAEMSALRMQALEAFIAEFEAAHGGPITVEEMVSAQQRLRDRLTRTHELASHRADPPIGRQ